MIDVVARTLNVHAQSADMILCTGVQDWSQPNKHAFSETASKPLTAVAYGQLPLESMSSPLFTTDNNADSMFGHHLSADLKYASNPPTDLLQQTLHMHVFNKPWQQAEAPSFNKSRLVSPFFSALGHNRRVEPDVYTKSGQLEHMSSPAHNSLLSNVISSLEIGDINKRPVTLLGHTHDSNAEAITESIGSPVLSSKRIPQEDNPSVGAVPSALSGQPLNSRCTSTGQSHHTRRLLAGVPLPLSLTFCQ